jgi:protein-disulfide isomerase
VIEYADFECHFCALARAKLEPLALRLVFRHFPVRSKHPRAFAVACAAEAAANQGRFWELHDALYADQGRLEDPHLWQYARDLGLDVDAFDSDRRSDAVAARVRRDFASGVRAGGATTPTLFVDGELHAGIPDAALLQRLGGGTGQCAV